MPQTPQEIEQELDYFAIRSFRDMADQDYIAARIACRMALPVQFLWSSEQAIEKYLKCILLLNRVPKPPRDQRLGHSLAAARALIEASGVRLDLTDPSLKFIEHVEAYAYRYLEVSIAVRYEDLAPLDRVVWELRRFCTRDPAPRNLKLGNGEGPPRVWLPGGILENIIDSKKPHSSRAQLLWQNVFFGRRRKKRARIWAGWHTINSPLSMNPHILDEVLKYVFLPDHIVKGYREHARSTPQV